MKNSKLISEAGGVASAGRSALIYDARCPLCLRAVDWIGKNSEKNAFEMLPCQSDALENKFPSIDREACMKALHLVLPDGTKYVGEQTLPFLLENMTRYRSLAILFKVPGALFACRMCYKLVASTRYWISRFLLLALPKT
jgi:predicted DCC family thiol-disulfide oxidoreductase YuxK